VSSTSPLRSGPVNFPGLVGSPADVEISSTLDYLRAMVAAYARTPDVGSVAVIGNAPLEPSVDRAVAIDACDVVFRCNSFVLDTPQKPPQQGARVDVVVFNRALRATPFVFDRYRERLYLVVEPGRLYREPIHRPKWWPADLGIVNVPNREVTLTLSHLLGLDSRNRREWATTGLLSLWIAMLLFPAADIVIAGFSIIDRPDQTEWQHAWGDSCPVGSEHHIAREGLLLASWIDDGRIRCLP